MFEEISFFYLKFIYSEKATKFCEISTLLLSYVVPVKCKVDILKNFVAFSEYMSFNSSNVPTIVYQWFWDFSLWKLYFWLDGSIIWIDTKKEATNILRHLKKTYFLIFQSFHWILFDFQFSTGLKLKNLESFSKNLNV